MALVPPAILGAISLLLLRQHTSLVRGVAGFLTAVFAAPGLLVVGAPLRSGRGVYLLAIAGSAVLWMVARRDRIAPGDASCRRHRGATSGSEYAWLAAACASAW